MAVRDVFDLLDLLYIRETYLLQTGFISKRKQKVVGAPKSMLCTNWTSRRCFITNMILGIKIS